MMPLGGLLEAADVISLHLALTPETAGMIDAAALRRMRRGAVIVNTARAGIIDTSALVAALSADHLGHAALDVFDEEPLPPSHPLLSLPNVTVTAHAGFKTDAALRRLLVEVLPGCDRSAHVRNLPYLRRPGLVSDSAHLRRQQVV